MLNSDKLEKKNQEYWRSEVDKIRKDSLHGSHYLADEALVIIEEFIPKLADAGIQNYAVVTGHQEQAKVFFYEFAKCLEPSKKQYHITTEQFPDEKKALAWLKTQ